jgi:hypothetical protein
VSARTFALRRASTVGGVSPSEVRDLTTKPSCGRIRVLEQIEGGEGLWRRLVVRRKGPGFVNGTQ